MFFRGYVMDTRTEQANEQRGQGKGNETAEMQKGDDACRCKEAAKMTPRQLLKLMMDDLAFWRKGKNG